MKYIFLFFIVLITSMPGKSQGTKVFLQYHKPYNFVQLYKLDSLGNSNSITKYFGELYFIFLQSIESQLAPADSVTKRLVQRFEKIFAQFYIDACEAYKNHQAIAIHEWQVYFSDSTLQPIQYKLLGTNAHLNGGLLQALTNSFSREEMNTLKNEFVIFKKSLNQTYKIVYHEAVASNKKIKNLDKMTIGFSQWIGNYYLYKWRKRQMRLAKLYWSGSPDYFYLLKRVNREKIRIDWLIIHTL